MKLLVLAAASWLASADGQSVQDTWEYGDLTPPSTLLPHTDAQLTFCAPRNIEVTSGKPIPTNTWWGNLITCDATTNVTMPVWANPFTITMETESSLGLYGYALAYPFRSRYFGDVSPSGIARYYGHAVYKEVLFSASEFAKTTPRLRVTDWSDLGVTVSMTIAPSTPMAMTSSIVSGMAFFTAAYTELSPRIGFQVPLTTINGATVKDNLVVSGTRFVITTVTGLQWVLYASSSVSFTLESNMVMRMLSTFTGTFRVAPVVTETPIGVYDTYKDCIVEGGNVKINSDSQYTFEWETSGSCSLGLLQFALPHQMASRDTSTTTEITSMRLRSTTRGEMRALVTTTSPPVWRFAEPSTIPITFYPKRRLTTTDATQQNLLNQLKSDIQAQWIISLQGSYYFNGKAAQKFASLCLMANDRVIVGSDISLLRRCVTKLEAAITPFLDNTWSHKLMYDRVYGGIVSNVGFATGDMNGDFGNTVYNDHHYHYGYWVYTAAVINYLHPTWTRINDLNRITRLLLRDVANPNNVDPFFPKFRHFDWFRGHSYSHGVTTFPDGKDEESTSEDVNFSYAMYLYGHATGHARMKSIASLMIKLTARAVQTYFLMESTNTVHPESFKPNKVTGIYFDNKVDYATWFSAEKYCIHGIQMIPATPVTEFVRSKNFVQEEWNQVLSKEAIVLNNDLTNPWLSLLYTNYARVDRAKALAVLQQVNVDDGLTRSWALYMGVQLS